MSATALESVLRRDRLVVAAALATLTAASFAYVVWLAAGMEMGAMPGMDMPAGPMPGMDMPAATMPGMKMSPAPAREAGGAMLAPAFAPWTPRHALLMVVMWAVMMVGMMTPSAAPMILLYARIARQAGARGAPFASTSWFAGGYLAAWTAFSAAATGAQWALESAALLTPMMASASPVFGGAVLVAAGLYQWTSLKHGCLAHCRAPFAFVQHHGGFRRDAAGALRLGLHHGLYCIGCCWALMALLFAGGVMNLMWIAGLTIFVLAEKLFAFGPALSRASGLVLIAAGAWLMFGPHAAM